jgi:hypothetical protein
MNELIKYLNLQLTVDKLALHLIHFCLKSNNLLVSEVALRIYALSTCQKFNVCLEFLAARSPIHKFFADTIKPLRQTISLR